MFFFRFLVATAILQLAHAQLEYVNIQAGTGLHFVHPEVPAGIGDVIVFSFGGPGPMNHSVVQSSYENPCHPLPGGFYSGFVPVPPGAQGGPLLFLVTINTTDPIYYYCGQVGHCQAGMVGVINPPCTGNGIDGPGTFAAFQSAAELVTSVGPIPTVIQGGQLVSTRPTSALTGSPGPTFSGFSASCTTKSNSSSNLTASTTTSAVRPTFSLGAGVSIRHQESPGLLGHVGLQLGIVSVALLAFIFF